MHSLTFYIEVESEWVLGAI